MDTPLFAKAVKGTLKDERRKTATDYDKIADEWDRTRQGLWGEFQFLKNLFSNRRRNDDIILATNLKVLDAGCGNGRLIKFLDREIGDYDYLGVDASTELLKKAKRNFPNKTFQNTDLIEFQSNVKFDIVTCVAVLHHLPSPADRLQVLRNLYQSLKLGGQLFLTVWSLWQPKYLKYVLKSYFASQPRDCRIPFQGKIERYVHAFTVSELLGLLERAGFRGVDVFGTAGENKAGLLTARNLVATAKK